MMPKSSRVISPLPIGARRPLGNLNAAMRDLDMDADHVRELIDEGLIAFNIASKKSRSELRILTKCVDFFLESGGKRFLVLEWPEIFGLIFPSEKLFINGLQVQRALNCDQGHVKTLILDGILIEVKKGKAGRGGSSIFTRSNFENFLIGRLL